VDKATFYANFVEASTIEDGFVFLDDAGNLCIPKTPSTTTQVGITAGIMAATIAVNVLAGAAGSNVAVFPRHLFAPGNADHNALVSDLKQFQTLSHIVGFRIGYGAVLLRIIIDADVATVDDIIRYFAIIHEDAFRFKRYSSTAPGAPHSMIIVQGAIVFSEHRKAKQFADQCSNKCVYCPSHYRSTQPWVIDLEDETVIKCVSFWTAGSRYHPLNSKKMLSRLFQKRLN
jgi:hypothetical protein